MKRATTPAQMKYRIEADGIYSRIVYCGRSGDFETFSAAKKQLIKDLRDRAEDFLWAIRETRRMTLADVEKDMEETDND